MESLTLDQLKGLAQQMQDPSISIFMPTHRAGPETQQDPIRFRNLLREVERRLSERGMGPRDVGEILQPAQALLGDSSFWRHLYDGLAVYVAAGDFHAFRLPMQSLQNGGTVYALSQKEMPTQSPVIAVLRY